eukprot:TRINITY_DN4004_c1_g9_i1.p1 TRINITY_DN4004_c1_g9~~TRINITY_DN4004_c1_g9_i1.p1  ORF type:complete len:154 (+),score=63.75 TRINITY_DN4004_c1_g9_i1:57-464(+)
MSIFFLIRDKLKSSLVDKSANQVPVQKIETGYLFASSVFGFFYAYRFIRANGELTLIREEAVRRKDIYEKDLQSKEEQIQNLQQIVNSAHTLLKENQQTVNNFETTNNLLEKNTSNFNTVTKIPRSINDELPLDI